MRKRIAIDMDEVLADSLGPHLEACNRAFGTRLRREDVRAGGLEASLPPGLRQAAFELLLAPGFFRGLPVMAGAQRAVRALQGRYDVFVASAAMEVPTSFADKYAWLREHFPFLPPSQIVFCGDKSVVRTDFLIDDMPRQLARFLGTPLLFGAPHNREETRFERLSDWEHAERVLLAADGRRMPASEEDACRASWTPAPGTPSTAASPR